LDTGGNVFGGFTPLQWESGHGEYKCADRLESSFHAENPHNTLARKFALKAEKKRYAICCGPSPGPAFGYEDGLFVHDNYSANTSGNTCLGDTNDTGVNGTSFSRVHPPSR
jgi:hypothetical protein